MRKTFPLQVWQTAGLILGIPLSHATRNLHSDNFTASHNINVADDGLCTRHRLQRSRASVLHGLPHQAVLLHPVNPMRQTFAPDWQGQVAQPEAGRHLPQQRTKRRRASLRMPCKKATHAPEKTSAYGQMRQYLYKCVIPVRSFHSLILVTAPHLALGMGPA
ncbi:hypothetical protein [Pseudomonas chlororaphis]|uniref:hypothetical protein n=1 Tax=Pseudomonas chlororaphis TaxID=587753 RepID=UPI0019D269FC|nr:hypothetical protein [Pseudomonas chlororaphis]